MTPAYLRKLADFVDPDQLWRMYGDLCPEDKKMRDAGIALRRHASHLEALDKLRAEGRSLLITPLSPNSSAIKSVKTPASHERLKGDMP